MNKEQIIQMAKKAGITCLGDLHLDLATLECYTALVIADEREACAKVCESTPKLRAYENNRAIQDECAAAIRARSNT
jgi:hypothetical protein